MNRIALLVAIALGFCFAQEQNLTFEVAAVTLAQPGTFRSPGFPLDAGDAFASTGGRFSAILPLSSYITFAYKISLTNDQRRALFAGLPGWMESDRYEIQAKTAAANPTKDEMRQMVRSLLTERFQLAVHFESKTVPVFFLTLAKPQQTGPKLHPHADGPACDQSPSKEVFPPICGSLMLQSQPNGVRAGSRDVTLQRLAETLPDIGKLDRPVLDRTEISGRFDYSLEWTSSAGIGLAPNRDPALAATDEANFMDAFDEQLGLKLQPARAPVQTLVIDRVARPKEN